MDVFVDTVGRPRCLLVGEAAGFVVVYFDDRVVLALRNAEAFERSESAAIGGLDEQRAVRVAASEQRDRFRHQGVPAVDSQVRPAGLVEHAEHHLRRRLPVMLGHLAPKGQKAGAVLLRVCLAGLRAGEADERTVVSMIPDITVGPPCHRTNNLNSRCVRIAFKPLAAFGIKSC